MKRTYQSLFVEKITRKILTSRHQNFYKKYFLVEHPKSGGTWVGEIIADSIGIEFPKNRTPSLRDNLYHSHSLPRKDITNPFIVYRDGRDVMISWYFHCLFINDRYNERLVYRMRKRLGFKDYKDVKHNIDRFIEFQFETGYPLGYSWPDFVRSWKNESHIPIFYEKMLNNPINEINRALHHINAIIPKEHLSQVISNYSFQKRAENTINKKNTIPFLRKGISGDWKNYFSDSTSKLFWQGAEDAMNILKYKK